MTNKTFTFPDGGNLYVEYSGNGNNTVTFTADENTGEDRELTLTFKIASNGNVIQRKVIQKKFQYTFDLSAITSSNTNLGVELGWQDADGTSVAQPFNLNGEEYNATVTNYWTNSTTEHTYNVIAERSVGKNYVFLANTYNNANYITSATINSTLPAVNLAYCFNNCRNLTSFEGGNLNVTNLSHTFCNCNHLTNLDGFANWDTQAVTTLYYTFYSCRNLTNLDGLANWNTEAVTNLSHTFSYCNHLTNLDGLANWGTSAVTTLSQTFSYCYNLTNLDGLANWNTGAVTNLSSTFSDCNNLTSLDGLANWNTQAVTNLFNTFSYCNHLTSLDGLANWNTGAVTNLYDTFSYCSNLTNLDGLANWNIGAVTNLSYTFNNCQNLTNLDGLANWNTGAVTTLYYTFYNCYNLTNLDGLANWNVAKVTNMVNTFYNCHNVITHGINNWTGASANCANMFRSCNRLDDVQIHFNITCAANMFAGRNTALNVYASTSTNAYNAIYRAMGNSTTNSNWNVTLYELEE